jgi:hypothetical protein
VPPLLRQAEALLFYPWSAASLARAMSPWE